MWNPFGKQEQPPAPAVVPGDQIARLGELDDTPINRAMILNFMLRFDCVLDPEKLKSSLETVLSKPGWRKLGARLRLNVCAGIVQASLCDYHVWWCEETRHGRQRVVVCDS